MTNVTDDAKEPSLGGSALNDGLGMSAISLMRETMTDTEFAEARIQLSASLQSHVLKKQNVGECAKSKELDPSGETFPFQCSCGVKHQFEYTENAEGLRLLSVK